MKTLSEWLARQRPTPKKRKPLARSPMSKVSPKRAKENRLYTKKRKAFLEANPWCGLGGATTATWKVEACGNRSEDIHHRAGRLNGNLLDESTWLQLCRRCHDDLHRHPKEARELGLLA